MPGDLRKIHTNGNAGLKYNNMIIVQNKNFYLRAAIIAVLLSSVYLKMYLIYTYKKISKRSAILFTRK